jgi:hypothetical protein
MAKAFATALAFFTCTAVACGGSGGGAIRQATPQETAAGYKDAMAQQEWERSFAYLARGAQESMVGAAYITAAYGSQISIELAESFGELANEYGLLGDDATMDQLDDLPLVFVDIVNWIAENLPAEHGGNAFILIAEQMAATEFTDFEIDGDRAKARMIHPEGSRPMTFGRIDGAWFIN